MFGAVLLNTNTVPLSLMCDVAIGVADIFGTGDTAVKGSSKKTNGVIHLKPSKQRTQGKKKMLNRCTLLWPYLKVTYAIVLP